MNICSMKDEQNNIKINLGLKILERTLKYANNSSYTESKYNLR